MEICHLGALPLDGTSKVGDLRLSELYDVQTLGDGESLKTDIISNVF